MVDGSRDDVWSVARGRINTVVGYLLYYVFKAWIACTG